MCVSMMDSRAYFIRDTASSLGIHGAHDPSTPWFHHLRQTQPYLYLIWSTVEGRGLGGGQVVDIQMCVLM